VIGSLYLNLSIVGNYPRKKKNQRCSPKPTNFNVLLWTRLCGWHEVKVSGLVVNINEIKKLFLQIRGGTSWP